MSNGKNIDNMSYTGKHVIPENQIPSTDKFTKGANFGESSFNNVEKNQNFSNFQNNNQNGQNTPKKPKRKKGPVFWIALFVLVGSLVALGIIGAGYLEGCMMYKDLADDVFKEGDNLNLSDMKIDWDKLRAINPDVIAWIYIPGTQINYPIVHTDNNEKYLKTTFRGEHSYISYGTIFMDCNNKHDISDPNIITYGHNMNDGTMYSTFAQMKHDDVFNAHRNIYFLTPAGNYRLKSFTLIRAAGTEKIVQPQFSTPQKMVEYINDKINRKVVNVEGSIPDASDMTKIFMFSTCDNLENTYRYICYAYVAESTVDGVPGLG